MFFHTRHRYNTRFLLLNCSLFSHWCFTHQYKNTTQFCFYAVPAASQNTNQQISDISYIKSNDNVEFERLYLAQHGHVVTLTSSFKLKKAIPQESYDIIVVGCLPQEMYPILETWFLVGEQGTNKAHMGRIRTSGQIELWCWGADALKIDFVFAFSTTFLTK